MPITCQLTLGESIGEAETFEFVDWVEENWLKDADVGTPFAILKGPLGLAHVRTTYPCFLSAKPRGLIPGSIVNRVTVLAKVAADGGEIAYDRPSARISYVS